MSKVKFELQVYCTVGWHDEEDIATLEVSTFTEVLEIAHVLKSWGVNRHANKEDEKIIQMYREIKESLESESGEEIMMVDEVIGIKCLYEDDKGIKSEMTLNDNSGVSGWAKIDSEEHENKYKQQLNEAKKLATEIIQL